MLTTFINPLIRRHIKTAELVGVSIRIASFSLVSWQGAQSPFLLVWICNTADALLLSWCAVLKKDRAYTLLNVFWVVIGVIGILRSGNLLK